MRTQSWVVRPDIFVFLKVGQAHLDQFPTPEIVAEEKARLMDRMSQKGVALFNADDTYVMSTARRCPARAMTFGVSRAADFRARDVRFEPQGMRFHFESPFGAAEVRTRLLGEHWVHAALASLAIATLCDFSPEEAAAELSRVEPVAGRLQMAALPSGARVLRDDYNPSLLSLEPALKVLERTAQQRRWLVIHDVDDSELDTQPRMELLARKAVEYGARGVFIGPHADVAASAAKAAGGTAVAVPGWEDAAAYLKRELKPGDVALLRGKEHSQVTRVFFGMQGTVGCHRNPCPWPGRICDSCQFLEFVPEVRS